MMRMGLEHAHPLTPSLPPCFRTCFMSASSRSRMACSSASRVVRFPPDAAAAAAAGSLACIERENGCGVELQAQEKMSAGWRRVLSGYRWDSAHWDMQAVHGEKRFLNFLATNSSPPPLVSLSLHLRPLSHSPPCPHSAGRSGHLDWPGAAGPPPWRPAPASAGRCAAVRPAARRPTRQRPLGRRARRRPWCGWERCAVRVCACGA